MVRIRFGLKDNKLDLLTRKMGVQLVDCVAVYQVYNRAGSTSKVCCFGLTPLPEIEIFRLWTECRLNYRPLCWDLGYTKAMITANIGLQVTTRHELWLCFELAVHETC